MKIEITLKDADGHVDIKTNPPLKKLMTLSREDLEGSAALTYAILGLKKMFGDSDAGTQEMEKEKREESAMRNGIIIPWKQNTEQGPQEVN